MATASSNHKSWVPPTGRHQVNIGSSFNRALKARKLKDAPTPPPPKRSNLPQHDFYALRYSHKPTTVDHAKPASIEVKKGAEHATIVAEVPSTQAGEGHHFSGHERAAGEVDCVLIFDEATGQFTLEKVDSTLSLKFIKTTASARSPLPASSPSPPLATVVSRKGVASTSASASKQSKDIPIDPELYRELLQGDEEDGEVVEPPRLPPRGAKQEMDDDELLSLARPSPPPSRPSTSAQSKPPRPAKAASKPQPAPSIPTAAPVPPTQSRPGAKLPPKPPAALPPAPRPTQSSGSPASRPPATHTKSSSQTSTLSSSTTAAKARPSAPTTSAPAPQAGSKVKKGAKRSSDASIDPAGADTVDPPPPTKRPRPLIPQKKKEPTPPPRAASPLAFPGGAGTYAPPPPLPGAKPPAKAGNTSGVQSRPSAPPKAAKPPPKPSVPAPQPSRLSFPTPVVSAAADDSDDDWVEATATQAPPPATQPGPFIIMEEEDPSLEPSVPRPPIFMEEVDGNDLDDGSMFGSNHGEVEPDALPVDDDDDDEDMEPVAVDDELHRELLMQMEGQMESQPDGYEEDEEEDFLSAAMTQPVPTGKPLSLNAYAGGANDDNSDEYTSTDESDDD